MRMRIALALCVVLLSSDAIGFGPPTISEAKLKLGLDLMADNGIGELDEWELRARDRFECLRLQCPLDGSTCQPAVRCNSRSLCTRTAPHSLNSTRSRRLSASRRRTPRPRFAR